MRLAPPAATFNDFAAEEVRPASFGQVVIDLAVVAEDGRNQQRFAQHVLPIQRVTAGVAGEFEDHGAHDGHAVLVGLAGCVEKIGHQAAFEFGEVAHHVHRFLVEEPGDTIRTAAMQATMR